MEPDHHLNLYRFFHESGEKVFIENNLSRAFALCLSNSPLFLDQYLRSVISKEDYEYLFSTYTLDERFEVNLQVDMSTIDIDNYRKVYAVAMTAEELDISVFLQQKAREAKEKNITDIWITIKDIALVIEVKRTGEDCLAQLYDQIKGFINIGIEVQAECCSWAKVIRTMERVDNLQQLMSVNTCFIRDFLRLSEIRYPEWFEPKPFSVLSFNSKWGTPEHTALMKRMKQALHGSAYELLSYNRLGIKAPFRWASEIIPEFQKYEDDPVNYIVFYIWPGNTKGQGYSIYGGSMAWLEKQSIVIDGKPYSMEIAYNVKFSHFNGYVSGFNFYDSDLKERLHTSTNFRKSGRWGIEDWDKFEQFMDQYFNSTFNWRANARWQEEFKDTDRTYFTVSFGFEVAVFIPYDEFRAIDINIQSIGEVSKKINKIANAFELLLN